MKRFRLSTLMLLIVITAMGVTLVVQQQRAARREAELQAQLEANNARMYYSSVQRSMNARMYYSSVQGSMLKTRSAYQAQKSSSPGPADGATGNKKGSRDGP